jgi:hypothetical protein
MRIWSFTNINKGERTNSISNRANWPMWGCVWLVFWRLPVRISARTHIDLSDILRSFSQSLQEIVGKVFSAGSRPFLCMSFEIQYSLSSSHSALCSVSHWDIEETTNKLRNRQINISIFTTKFNLIFDVLQIYFLWIIMSSGRWHRVVWQNLRDVLEKHIDSIFRVAEQAEQWSKQRTAFCFLF